MLGLLGWLLFGGAAIKQACDVSGFNGSAEAAAKAGGELYFRDYQNNLRLVGSNKQVWLKEIGTHKCLVDESGKVICDYTQAKLDKKYQEELLPVQEKAKELGITDRDWIYLNTELEWKCPWEDARVDLNTGEKFGVIMLGDLRKAKYKDDLTFYIHKNAEYEDYNSRTGLTAHRDMPIFTCVRFQIDTKDVLKQRWSDYGILYEKDYDRFAYRFLIKQCRQDWKRNCRGYAERMYDEISLTDYIFKYRGLISDIKMDFLLRLGAVKSKKVKEYPLIVRDWDALTEGHLVATEYMALHSKVEDIVEVNEDILKKFNEEAKKIPYKPTRGGECHCWGHSWMETDFFKSWLKY